MDENTEARLIATEQRVAAMESDIKEIKSDVRACRRKSQIALMKALI